MVIPQAFDHNHILLHFMRWGIAVVLVLKHEGFNALDRLNNI